MPPNVYAISALSLYVYSQFDSLSLSCDIHIERERKATLFEVAVSSDWKSMLHTKYRSPPRRTTRLPVAIWSLLFHSSVLYGTESLTRVSLSLSAVFRQDESRPPPPPSFLPLGGHDQTWESSKCIQLANVH